MFACPCCNSPMPEPPKPEFLSNLRLSSLERVLADTMVKRYPNPVSLPTLVDAVYSGQPNGGPLFAGETIKVTITRMRKKLSKAGWTISYNDGGKGVPGSYQLETMTFFE